MSYRTQFLHVFCFSFFVLGKLFEYFSFYSPILLTLWFRNLQTCIKESCMYLSSQLFKAPSKTLKFQEKCILQQSADINFKNFPFGVHHEAIAMEPLNLANSEETDSLGENSCRQRCLDKSLGSPWCTINESFYLKKKECFVFKISWYLFLWNPRISKSMTPS